MGATRRMNVQQHRRTLPGTVASVEMFSDVIISQGDDDPPVVVQIMQRWWIRDDGSWEVAAHRVDDPLTGYHREGDDREMHDCILAHTNAMRSLACCIFVILWLCLA